MRKKRKFLQTNFIKFILEKYEQDRQDIPESEIQSEDEMEFKKRVKRLNEFDDEVEDEQDEIQDENEDEIIDELLNEYKKLKRKYESSKFLKRRK